MRGVVQRYANLRPKPSQCTNMIWIAVLEASGGFAAHNNVIVIQQSQCFHVGATEKFLSPRPAPTQIDRHITSNGHIYTASQ